jgi:hypothetical protein
LVTSDCDSRFCTANVCEPRKPGRKDGDESDIDCGGRVAPGCSADQVCGADADCASTACSSRTFKCLEGPSCKSYLGGETCGTGEVGDAAAKHESCCRSLPVANFTDPTRVGKKVYVDKYEITAGRMRTFLDAMAAQFNGQPNVRNWITTHRPPRWKNEWERALPSGYTTANEPFSIVQPTVDRAYPGQDIYLGRYTQSTWSITTGNFTMATGVYYALGAGHLFPEYYTNPNVGWPAPDYAVTHGYNCGNGNGSYGLGTYYFDDATVAQYSGGAGKYFTQAQLDVKSLNCTPTALFAAFCAWDGGELATDTAMGAIGGGGRVNSYPQGPAGGDCNQLNIASDGSQTCRAQNVYYYPPDGGNSRSGASRIAAPGRVLADAVRIGANDEPWFDMKGNLMDMYVVTSGPDNMGFMYSGLGMGYGTIQHHRTQVLTPRMKSGAVGARCMRFK